MHSIRNLNLHTCIYANLPHAGMGFVGGQVVHTVLTPSWPAVRFWGRLGAGGCHVQKTFPRFRESRERQQIGRRIPSLQAYHTAFDMLVQVTKETPTN